MNVFGETFGVEEDQLTGLFQKKIGLGTMDNFWKSTAWQCYQDALPVRDKLYRYGSVMIRACLRCEQGNETVQHALSQCPCITDRYSFVEL